MEELEERIAVVESTNTGGQAQCTETAKAIKRLEYKAMDQEAGSRRNNVIVYNLAENVDNNTEEIFRDFVRNKLGVDKPIAIQRVYRLGARRMARDGNNKPRPIIAGLRDYPDVDICITKAKKMKGTRLGISRDYPENSKW